jgi:hypothetical protein
MMKAKRFENTGSVIKLQARKRNTSQKRKNAKFLKQMDAILMINKIILVLKNY